MTPADFNRRIPTKAPGRPAIRRELMAMAGIDRNQADQFRSVIRGIPEPLREELLAKAGAKLTTMTILSYVARFRPEDQREMFTVLNELGSRGAKRFVECQTRPPSAKTISLTLLGFAEREFPGVPLARVIEGFERAASALAGPNRGPFSARGYMRGYIQT